MPSGSSKASIPNFDRQAENPSCKPSAQMSRSVLIRGAVPVLWWLAEADSMGKEPETLDSLGTWEECCVGHMSHMSHTEQAARLSHSLKSRGAESFSLRTGYPYIDAAMRQLNQA